jgi:hypothetical protein
MKHFYSLTTLLFLLIVGSTTAQNNNVFNYQAVAHDANYDTVLRNKAINVDFYITTDDSDPVNNYEYTEQHQLTTNNYGLFNLQIGDSDPSLFSNLDWVNNSYYLGVAINNILISTQLLVAVPFALHANSASQTANAATVNNLTVESAVPADASFSDNQTLIITADSLIISNGNGISLDSISSDDNDWTVDGNNIENGNSGNVGIGNTTLTGKLNVSTDANTTRAIYIENNTSSNTFEKMGVYAMVSGGGTSDNTGAWFDVMGNATGTNIAVGGYASGSGGENRGVYGSATNGTTNWAGYFDGNVKVRDNLVLGTATNPSQFQYKDGNQGLGRILRSDAQGNAQWSTISSLAAGIMLNPIYDNNNNNVVDNAELVNGYQVNSNVPSNASFTDNQTLSLSSDSLVISNGNAIALDDISPQNLSINNLSDGYTTNNNLFLANQPANSQSGTRNIAFGENTLQNNTTGNNNIAIGADALKNSLNSDQTAVGVYALSNNTNGIQNNAFGVYSLESNSMGNRNNAFGYGTLNKNTSGSDNTAYGHTSLFYNINGNSNTAFGSRALIENTTGSSNTAVGHNAIPNNTTGIGNTAVGYIALESNTLGGENTAVGQNNMTNNTTGSQNTAIGSGTLSSNTIGNGNVAIGLNSMYKSLDGATNTAVGYGSLFLNINGSSNAAVGYNALSSNLGSQNTAIGQLAGSGQTNANQNTFVGYNSNVSSASLTLSVNNATAIGANTVLVQSNSVVLGNNADVGIGTSSPTQRLDVDGAIRMRAGPYSTGDIIAAGPDGTMIWTPVDSVVSSSNINQLDDGYSDNQNNLIFSNPGLLVNSFSNSNSNSAIGRNSLQNITTGSGNTALGFSTLLNNTTGNTNTAVGINSLESNTTGNYNTSVGETSLRQNINGNGNVAVGHKALESNTSGEFNVSVGSYSLQKSTNSSSNVAVGERALDNNTTGQENVGLGRGTLSSNTTGNQNTAIGYAANVGSSNLTNATAIGAGATVTSSNSVVLGNNANIGIGTTNPSEKLHIGSGTLKIGNSNNSYTFPNSRGSDGQVLRISHSTPGQLEWQNVGPTTNEINLSPHDFKTVTSVVYGGYYRNVIQLGNGGGTNEGSNHYDFPTPNDWDGSSMTVTVYYSSSKNDGNITFTLTGESYSVGQSGYVNTGANNSLNVAQPYTLYSYTKTLYFGSNSGGSDLLSIMFSRYDYQYSGNPNQDTNTGFMYIHGIKISYPTN